MLEIIAFIYWVLICNLILHIFDLENRNNKLWKNIVGATLVAAISIFFYIGCDSYPDFMSDFLIGVTLIGIVMWALGVL